MELQDAKDKNRLVSKMMSLVNYFGSHLHDTRPNITPTMLDECRSMIVGGNPEVADRNFHVIFP